MTIKKTFTLENGRITPTNESIDADILEVSTDNDNALEIRPEGLFINPFKVVEWDPYKYGKTETEILLPPTAHYTDNIFKFDESKLQLDLISLEHINSAIGISNNILWEDSKFIFPPDTTDMMSMYFINSHTMFDMSALEDDGTNISFIFINTSDKIDIDNINMSDLMGIFESNGICELSIRFNEVDANGNTVYVAPYTTKYTFGVDGDKLLFNDIIIQDVPTDGNWLIITQIYAPGPFIASHELSFGIASALLKMTVSNETSIVEMLIDVNSNTAMTAIDADHNIKFAVLTSPVIGSVIMNNNDQSMIDERFISVDNKIKIRIDYDIWSLYDFVDETYIIIFRIDREIHSFEYTDIEPLLTSKKTSSIDRNIHVEILQWGKSSIVNADLPDNPSQSIIYKAISNGKYANKDIKINDHIIFYDDYSDIIIIKISGGSLDELPFKWNPNTKLESAKSNPPSGKSVIEYLDNTYLTKITESSNCIISYNNTLDIKLSSLYDNKLHMYGDGLYCNMDIDLSSYVTTNDLNNKNYLTLNNANNIYVKTTDIINDTTSASDTNVLDSVSTINLITNKIESNNNMIIDTIQTEIATLLDELI